MTETNAPAIGRPSWSSRATPVTFTPRRRGISTSRALPGSRVRRTTRAGRSGRPSKGRTRTVKEPLAIASTANRPETSVVTSARATVAPFLPPLDEVTRTVKPAMAAGSSATTRPETFPAGRRVIPLVPTCAIPSGVSNRRTCTPNPDVSTRTSRSSSGRNARRMALPSRSVIVEANRATRSGTSGTSRATRTGTIRAPSTGRPSGPATTNGEPVEASSSRRNGRPSTESRSIGHDAATEPSRSAQSVGRSQSVGSSRSIRTNRPSPSAVVRPSSTGNSPSHAPPLATTSAPAAGLPSSSTTTPRKVPRSATPSPTPTAASESRKAINVAAMSRGSGIRKPKASRSNHVDRQRLDGSANKGIGGKDGWRPLGDSDRQRGP